MIKQVVFALSITSLCGGSLSAYSRIENDSEEKKGLQRLFSQQIRSKKFITKLERKKIRRQQKGLRRQERREAFLWAKKNGILKKKRILQAYRAYKAKIRKAAAQKLPVPAVIPELRTVSVMQPHKVQIVANTPTPIAMTPIVASVLIGSIKTLPVSAPNIKQENVIVTALQEEGHRISAQGVFEAEAIIPPAVLVVPLIPEPVAVLSEEPAAPAPESRAEPRNNPAPGLARMFSSRRMTVSSGRGRPPRESIAAQAVHHSDDQKNIAALDLSKFSQRSFQQPVLDDVKGEKKLEENISPRGEKTASETPEAPRPIFPVFSVFPVFAMSEYAEEPSVSVKEAPDVPDPLPVKATVEAAGTESVQSFSSDTDSISEDLQIPALDLDLVARRKAPLNIPALMKYAIEIDDDTVVSQAPSDARTPVDDEARAPGSAYDYEAPAQADVFNESYDALPAYIPPPSDDDGIVINTAEAPHLSDEDGIAISAEDTVSPADASETTVPKPAASGGWFSGWLPSWGSAAASPTAGPAEKPVGRFGSHAQL